LINSKDPDPDPQFYGLFTEGSESEQIITDPEGPNTYGTRNKMDKAAFTIYK
jgi:hypothetical protein